MIFNLRSLPGPWSAVIIKHISKNSHAYFGSLQKLEKMLIYKGPLFIGQRLRDCSRTPNYGIRGFMKAAQMACEQYLIAIQKKKKKKEKKNHRLTA